MKRLVIFISIIILLYSVYYDLSTGTLEMITPKQSVTAASETVAEVDSTPEKQEDTQIPYKVMEVKPGDTVLSMVEDLTDGTLPVTIEQVISDFETLNKKRSPHEIQIGQRYKIPLYK
ncbi:hypothetical protein [Bacillus seohaeanensis]|jgi:hypothetical protein|uniref:LysM domain-containing protein n=1 Tax=Bacillus seohaeanensis TaxID=284580 RepID=A0ABW5RNW4_9BACI